MTLRDDIRTALREVPSLLGASWQFNARTSGPAAEPQTRAAWSSAVSAHQTSATDSTEYDERTGGSRRVERCRLRVSDAETVYHIGDQARPYNDATQTWAIIAVESSGVGTRAYTLERIYPLKAGPDRGGVA